LNADRLPPGAAYLVEAAASAPSADNSQPWCFDWDGHTLTARVHRRGGFPADHHATTLALGAAAENLACALQAAGLDATAWRFGLPEADGVFAQGPVAAIHALPALEPDPLWKRRHTNRLPYHRTIEPEIATQLDHCRAGGAAVRVMTGPAIRQAADWVRQASEVRFQTREVNEWFAASLRYGDSAEDFASGLHVATLALPPGGVSLLKLMSDWNRLQWLNRLRAYKFFAAIEAANFQKAPLVVAITGATGPEAAFEAGRCLQRVWLKATELGLSAQPYYVVPDLLNRLESNGIPEQCLAQGIALREQIGREFGKDARPHCMLRVGKPFGRIPVSGRLSVDQVMCGRERRC
jgi:nitroreductase